MRRGLLLVVTVVSLAVGCGRSAPPAEPTAVNLSTPPPAAPTEAQAPKGVVVEMSAATLADDCGGAPPSGPPTKRASQVKGDSPVDGPGSSAKAKRKCEQTSMQLTVTSPADAAAAEIVVKHVEIFDDRGVSIGTLRASAPRVWSADGVYVDWDQKVAPGSQLAVSYALSAPAWNGVDDRADKTYVVKAVLTIAGADHPVERRVEVKAPTSFPAAVKT